MRGSNPRPQDYFNSCKRLHSHFKCVKVLRSTNWANRVWCIKLQSLYNYSMFIIKDPLYNGYIFWWNIIKIKKLDAGTSHLIFIYPYSALTHIFLRLFYPWDFYPYIFSAILPIFFAAILPIFFFGYFTHIFFRLFYPYFLRLNHKFSWEYIILSSHIVVRIYCEHFGCLFLLVRLYTEFPWEYTKVPT